MLEVSFGRLYVGTYSKWDHRSSNDRKVVCTYLPTYLGRYKYLYNHFCKFLPSIYRYYIPRHRYTYL